MILFLILCNNGEGDLDHFVSAPSRHQAIELWKDASMELFGYLPTDKSWSQVRADLTPDQIFIVPRVATEARVHHWHVPGDVVEVTNLEELQVIRVAQEMGLYHPAS